MKEQQEAKWHELIKQKDKFIEIIRVLNRFYQMHPAIIKTNSTQLFREEIVEIAPVDLRICIRKIGNYEYLIKVIILETGKQESWIHVDGIQQERDELLQDGKTAHPVHGITNLTDLFKQSRQI